MKKSGMGHWISSHKVLAIIIGLLVLLGSAWTVGAITGGWTCKMKDGFSCQWRDNTNPPPEQPTSPDNTIPLEQEVTLQGMIVCLPHKADGPVTLECAIGMQTEDGTYYALHDTTPTHSFIGQVQTHNNNAVKVSGILRPDNDSKYENVGILTITSFEAQ